MYLHIGKEYVLNSKDIIGIFDIDVIKKSREYGKMYDTIKDNVVDISDGLPKTLILLKGDVVKGYITNISSVTLRKRVVF